MVIKVKTLKGLTKEQEKIHDGLLQIGDLLGSFYLDALMILSEDCVLSTKVNLLAHLAREIDGGFKDVFAPKELKSKKEASMSGEKNGNHAAILVALGFDQPEIAEEWLSISKNFHQLAHRHEVWLQPKDLTNMQSLWARYEKILSILTGSTYAFRDRINHITSLEKPSREILGALDNLLKNKQNEVQFFRSLSSSQWLRPLYEKGTFNIDNKNAYINENGKFVVKDWLPLNYLVNISKTAGRHDQMLIIRIVEQLKDDVLSDRVLLDDYSIYMLLEIIANLKEYHFNGDHVKILDKYNLEFKDQHSHIYSSVLTEVLISKYISEGNKSALHTLLMFCFDFYVIEESTLWLEELGINTNKRVIPKVESMAYYRLEEKIEDIAKLDGEDLLNGLAEIIANLSKEKPYDLDCIPSIEHSEQTQMYVYDWNLSLIIFFRDTAEKMSPDQQGRLISNLLDSNTQILQRIGLHLIRLTYKDNGKFLWIWLQKQKLSGIFNIHEIYLLINQHSIEMSIDEIKTLTAWIENIYYDPTLFKEEDAIIYKNFRIRCYLEAVIPGNENIAKHLKILKDKYRDLSPGEITHPEFDGFTTTGFPNEPIEEMEDFSNKSFKLQVSILAKNTPEGYFDRKASGLGNLLNNDIIENPEKFANEIEHFRDLNAYYQSFFISAFTSVVKNGPIPRQLFLSNQIISTISSDEWMDDGTKSDRLQVLNDSAEFFLQLSYKKESREIPEDEINKILEFLIKLCGWDYFKSPDHVSSNGYREHYINSMQGRAFDALINWGKIWGENYGNEDTKIHPMIQHYIESNVGRNTEMDKDFSLGMGYHLSYFLLVHYNWFEKNIAKVFPIDNDLHLEYTIGAMLASFNGVSKNNVNFLRLSGLNKHVIANNNSKSWEAHRLVRFAMSEYYWNKEILNDRESLLGMILDHGTPIQYSKVIDHCVEMGHFTKDDTVKLWKTLLNKCLEKQGEYQEVLKILPNLVRLTKFTEETIKLAELSIPYLGTDQLTYRFIHSLVTVEASELARSAEVVLKIWKETKTPVYISKELSSMVEKLFSSGDTKIAFEICDYAGENGNITLKTIYDQYKLIGLKI